MKSTIEFSATSDVARHLDVLRYAVSLGTPIGENGAAQVGIPSTEVSTWPKDQLIAGPIFNRYCGGQKMGFQFGWRAVDQDDNTNMIDPDKPLSIEDNAEGVVENQSDVIAPGLPGGFILKLNSMTGKLVPEINPNVIHNPERFEYFVRVVALRAMKKTADRMSSRLFVGQSPYC